MADQPETAAAHNPSIAGPAQHVAEVAAAGAAPVATAAIHPDVQAQHLAAIKKMTADHHALLATLGSSSELAIAGWKVEEAGMWATKHVTR